MQQLVVQSSSELQSGAVRRVSRIIPDQLSPVVMLKSVLVLHGRPPGVRYNDSRAWLGIAKEIVGLCLRGVGLTRDTIDYRYGLLYDKPVLATFALYRAGQVFGPN